MKRSLALTRRQFVIGAAAVAGGALVLSVALIGRRRSQLAHAGPGSLNAYVRIDGTGHVTLIMPKVEMGQGTYTSLPMLIAEELEVALERISVEAAPPDPAVYGVEGDQSTGGSTSIKDCWLPLRQAGATARLMLMQAAAKRWGVALNTCQALQGEVIHAGSGRRLGYGALAAAAAALPVPIPPPLKAAKDFRLIGRSTPRRDTPEKVNGSAIFGIDVRPPRAKVAVIALSPVEGGRIAEPFTGDAALSIRGVTQVVDEGDLIAVVADRTWAAIKGLRALALRWDEGANGTVQQAALVSELDSASREEGAVAARRGKPAGAPAHAATH
ncbi:MAG TPA: molybdopterin cofactor-binding domain-containing protein, partial [Steroidobacteraceae bacterium]|nr:molybdopterin cofactor-binding domain-containing protein [Steroidobacteraceae bacterium]